MVARPMPFGFSTLSRWHICYFPSIHLVRYIFNRVSGLFKKS